MKIGMVIAPLISVFKDIQEIGEVIFIRESGIKHIEIHTNFLDNYLDQFLKLSEDFGLTYSIHCPHMYFNIPTNFCSANQKDIKVSDEWLKKSIDYAKTLGAKNIVIHADIPIKCSRKEALDILEEHIRNGMKILDKGQIILIENMPGKKYALSTPSEFSEFLKRFMGRGKDRNKVGVCWDIGHEFGRYQKQSYSFPDVLGKRIKEVHISGIKKNKGHIADHFPIDNNCLADLGVVAGKLKKIQFRGPIIMEVITHNPLDIIESKNELEKFM